MKKSIFHTLTLGLAASMLLASLTGCGGGTAEDAASGTTDAAGTENAAAEGTSVSGGTLRFGLSADPLSIDPAVLSGKAGEAVEGAIYNCLITYAEDGSMIPALAESWETGDDGMSYTFHLIDTTFHNGEPLTSEDVKYTVERQYDAAVGAVMGANIQKMIASIECPDEKTVVFNMNAPDMAFLDYLCGPNFLIVCKSWTEEHDGNLNENPNGTGAFKFVSYTSGERITVEKNENYFKPDEPYLDGIDFIIYTDETARANALYSGDIDMLEYVPANDMNDFLADDTMKVYVDEGMWLGLEYNCTAAPFDDPKVRQALGYAIDRDAVREAAFAGRGKSLYGMPTAEGIVGYDEAYANYYTYDPQKAKELLAEAGYPDGFDATILSCSTYDFFDKSSTVIQANLKEIGVNLTIDNPDWGTYMSRAPMGDFEMTVRGAPSYIADPEWVNLYSNAALSSCWNQSTDTTLNDMFAEACATFTTETRDPAMKNVSKYYLEESNPIIFLTAREQSYASTAKIEGFYYNYFAGLNSFDAMHFTE